MPITWIVLPLMVFATYRITNRGLRWVFILLPPLSLLVLIWVPFDRNTMYSWWVPAILATYGSILSIALNLMAGLFQMMWTCRVIRPPVGIRLIRPMLVVCIMGGLTARERLAVRAVDAYALDLALRTQAACDTNRVCPKMMPGWEMIEENPTFRRCATYVKKYGRRSLLRYDQSWDGFEVQVRHNAWGWLTIAGGVDKELTARQDGRIIDIHEWTRARSGSAIPNGMPTDPNLRRVGYVS
ncbi:MAG: hypothetical protein JW955_03795 [Sedimentisphaerales bacterium]|nr:hypothetical protein [Sedimentisphaerales bacterium]